ncbi:hypothetical protein LCGC14_1703240 [marine sediment metagenome]|uniref:Uncharacterized protein n=1 Tax=marine sediment metagenome TaxID=412755 RepID=A0A0F9I4X7_9ZZZZ
MPDKTDPGRTQSYPVMIGYAIRDICKQLATHPDRPTDLDITITRLCRAFLLVYNAQTSARAFIAQHPHIPTLGDPIELDAELYAILTGKNADG